jgi:nucleoid-associated protein YgaU
MAPEEKKNILDQAIDLISNRDEKAAAEEANLKAAAAQEAAARAQADKAAAEKIAADAQAKVKEMETQATTEANAKAVEARNADIKKMLDAQKAAEILTTHTVVAGETLSDISMKYYKSAVREKWILIYEANKAVIGDNPGMIKAGQDLKIPKI